MAFVISLGSLSLVAKTCLYSKFAFFNSFAKAGSTPEYKSTSSILYFFGANKSGLTCNKCLHLTSDRYISDCIDNLSPSLGSPAYESGRSSKSGDISSACSVKPNHSPGSARPMAELPLSDCAV